MDGQPAPASVVLQTGRQAGTSASLALHPLPILSISDHLTRARVQAGPDSAGVRVYGALLGTQTARDVEIHNTFEIKVANVPDGQGEGSRPAQVDLAFFRSRQAQFKQTFPSFDFLGWYSNGTQPSASDMDVHKQLFEFNETPLFLQLSPNQSALDAASGRGELPLQVYETHVEMAPKAADSAAGVVLEGVQTYFVEGAYKIETGEAERIAVDYASKPSGTGTEGDTDTLVSNLTTQRSAIKMLFDRINVCRDYVAGVREGTVPRDNETLRQINSIMCSMPAIDSPDFRDEFLKEYNDVMLTKYLASMTSGLNSLNELVDKFDVVSSAVERDERTRYAAGGRDRERQQRSRRAGGRS